MHIEHEESDIRGRHFINDESGNMLAEITYAVRHPDTMVVDHTEVSETLKGKNIGKQLVSAVVEHAKLKGRHIIAACPFTRSVMEKTEGYRELLVHEPLEEKMEHPGEEKDTVYDPAGLNLSAPAPGMAAVNTFNSDEMEETKESNKSHGSHESNRSKESQRSDRAHHSSTDETHGAELNITSNASEKPGEVDGTRSVDADVTPRNLEADSDGA